MYDEPPPPDYETNILLLCVANDFREFYSNLLAWKSFLGDIYELYLAISKLNTIFLQINLFEREN